MVEYIASTDALGLFPETMSPTATRPQRRQVGTPPALASTSFAEFFAGIGLVRYALEAEGWHAQFANDIDPNKQAIYALNFGTSHFLLKDINAVTAKDVPTVGLATASFPCTDLSLAGQRKGLAGSESGTFWSFTKILSDMGARKPSLVLLENVVGFLSCHGGSDFQKAIEHLNRLGYHCDCLILNAVHFVPQSRSRLFVIGSLEGVTPRYKTISDPRLLAETDCRPIQLLAVLRQHPRLAWRFNAEIGPLPPLRRNLADLLEDFPSSSDVWWPPQRTRHLLQQLSPRHHETVRHLRSLDHTSNATVYKRMRAGTIRAEVRSDSISGCLRTPRGGSSRQIVLSAGKGRVQVRHMTPREYARLQGVPDSFRIGEDTIKALFGFGDAICVPAVRWLVRNLINPFVQNA